MNLFCKYIRPLFEGKRFLYKHLIKQLAHFAETITLTHYNNANAQLATNSLPLTLSQCHLMFSLYTCTVNLKIPLLYTLHTHLNYKIAIAMNKDNHVQISKQQSQNLTSSIILLFTSIILL